MKSRFNLYLEGAPSGDQFVLEVDKTPLTIYRREVTVSSCEELSKFLDQRRRNIVEGRIMRTRDKKGVLESTHGRICIDLSHRIKL